jgi:tungstate transport system substrate-binding protein
MLSNPYGVIAVSPTINDQINAEGAQAFVDWIISPETQELIGAYEINGDPLFTPNAAQK